MEQLDKGKALNKIIIMLKCAKNVEDFAEVLGYTMNEFQFSRGYLYQLDDDEMYRLRVQTVGSQDNIPTEYITEADAIHIQNTSKKLSYGLINYNANNLEIDLGIRAFAKKINAKTMLVMPLIDDKDKLIGIVGFDDCKKIRKIEKDELEILESIFTIILSNLEVLCYKEQVEKINRTMVDVIDNTGLEIYVVDYKKFELIYVNKRLQEKYNNRIQLGQKCWTLYGHNCICPDCPHKNLVHDSKMVNKPIIRENYVKMIDKWFKTSHSIYRWSDGRLVHAVSRMDITENKLNMEKANRIIYHDLELDIYNRHKFQIDLENAMNNVNIYNTRGFLIIVDIDDLMLINEEYGWKAGDNILKQFARYICSYNLYHKNVYRYSADRFAIIAEDVLKADIEAFAEDIKIRCRQMWVVGVHDIKCTASIGIASYPEHGINSDQILKSTEKALVSVKKQGKNNSKIYEQI